MGSFKGKTQSVRVLLDTNVIVDDDANLNPVHVNVLKLCHQLIYGYSYALFLIFTAIKANQDFRIKVSDRIKAGGYAIAVWDNANSYSYILYSRKSAM